MTKHMTDEKPKIVKNNPNKLFSDRDQLESKVLNILNGSSI